MNQVCKSNWSKWKCNEPTILSDDNGDVRDDGYAKDVAIFKSNMLRQFKIKISL